MYKDFRQASFEPGHPLHARTEPCKTHVQDRPQRLGQYERCASNSKRVELDLVVRSTTSWTIPRPRRMHSDRLREKEKMEELSHENPRARPCTLRVRCDRAAACKHQSARRNRRNPYDALPRRHVLFNTALWRCGCDEASFNSKAKPQQNPPPVHIISFKTLTFPFTTQDEHCR